MAIIRNANTTGAKSNSTLSGNIALNQGQGELVSYQTNENGEKFLTYKIDYDGIHYYNEDGVETSLFSPNGVFYYDEDGDLLSKISGTSTEYYDGSGNVISKIDTNGVHYYNTSGEEITKVSSDGFDYYDTNGVKRINIGASSAGMMRIEMFDTDGTPRTLIGQNPADGDQVLAVSVFGENVETNLNPNNRGGGDNGDDDNTGGENNRSRGEINDGEL